MKKQEGITAADIITLFIIILIVGSLGAYRFYQYKKSIEGKDFTGTKCRWQNVPLDAWFPDKKLVCECVTSKGENERN